MPHRTPHPHMRIGAAVCACAEMLITSRHQIFLGGSSDENEKVLGKFLARLRRAKKGVPKFFACGGLFFVVEALKTVKKPLIFRIFSQKPSNF